jgi:hypothetical protein
MLGYLLGRNSSASVSQHPGSVWVRPDALTAQPSCERPNPMPLLRKPDCSLPCFSFPWVRISSSYAGLGQKPALSKFHTLTRYTAGIRWCHYPAATHQALSQLTVIWAGRETRITFDGRRAAIQALRLPLQSDVVSVRDATCHRSQGIVPGSLRILISTHSCC